MPNRVIREEILESERWAEVSCVERCCYFSLLLKADDCGNAEAGPQRLTRLWGLYLNTKETVNTVIKHLAEVDLVRPYEVDGKKFVHVPRFRQYVRHVRRRNPMSPWDDNAKIQEVANKDALRTQRERTANALRTRPESNRIESNRIETNRKKPSAPSDARAAASPSPIFIEIPLNDGSGYPILESDLVEFAVLYPQVDVPQTLREIRGWNLANPTKRKTRAGALRHVNAWLAKEQNRG